MTCDQVAVVRARLEADVAAELLGAPAATAALLAWVERELGPCTVRSATPAALDLAVGGRPATLEVRLDPPGLVLAGRDGGLAADVARRLEAFARDLAAAAARERLVGALKRRYAVTADERGPGGARLLTLEL